MVRRVAQAVKVVNLHLIRLAHPWKTRIYVVLQTDDGMSGVGEASLGQLSRAVAGAIRDIEPLVIGLDPHDIAVLRQRVWRDIYADGGQVVSAALAGVEMALWDIVAQAAGVPLFQLIGGRIQPRLRVYANGWYRGAREPDTMGRLAQQAASRGYTALKIDPFGANWRTITQREIDFAIDILRAVRAAVGAKVDLLVEGHSRFDVAMASRIARLIEPLNPLWFEEPLPYWDVRGYSELTSQVSIPIAAGESLWRVDQFAGLLGAARLHVVQFDPIHVGGIAASRAIAELALAHNAVLAPHSASGAVNELVCAHLGMSTPHTLVLERFEDFEPDDPSSTLIRSALRVEGGMAELGDRPGIGAQFSLAELLASHTDADREDQNLFQPGWELRKSR